jgi:hypothetical protein
MRKLIALLLSTGLLTGCTSTSEFGEVSSAIRDSQEMQAEETQSPEPEPLPTFELSTLGADPNLCKFEDKTSEFASREPWMPMTYFPNVSTDPYYIPTIGEANVALVFLDWGDKQGTDEDRDYYLEQAEIMADWYQMISQEKSSINWRISDRWGRLPGSWEDMKRGSRRSQDDESDPVLNQEVLDLAVAATDEYFDYTGIDYVIFAIPLSGSLTLQGYESGDVVIYAGLHGRQWYIHPNPDPLVTSVNTQEGSMGNWVLGGTTFQDTKGRSPAWAFWAHEMGHMLGFKSHDFQPTVEQDSAFYNNPIGAAGIFAHQWYQVRAVSGWNSWIAGWLDDDQVRCVEATEVEDEVFSVNNRREVSGETKMVILRTGETTGLVIESREWDPEFDAPTQKAADGFYDGILMYHIDSSRPLADQSMIPLMPHGTDEVWDQGMWPGPAVSGADSMFQEGESAEYQDFTIEVLSMQDGVDYVRVRRSTAAE